MQHGGQSNGNILVGDGQKLHGKTEAQYAEERQQNRLWKGHGPKSPKSSQNQSLSLIHIFIKVIIRCCEALKEVMEEFADFRKSKTLHGLIIEINALEEEGDRLFIESMRRLHALSLIHI